MAFSDWYEVIHTQVYLGQVCINVYHVLRDNAGVSALTVAESYNDTIMPPLADIQFTSVLNTEISARSLDDPGDFATRVPDLPAGLRIGDGAQTFMALSIQFNRTRTDMKNGQKRYVAGVEADNIGNTWQASIKADAALVAIAILDPWELGGVPGVAQCRFGVLQRVCIEQPPPDPCPGYRLPESDAELVFYLPNTAIVRGNVRSQVSRKVL